MKSLTDILCWVVAAAAIVVGLWQLTVFLTYRDAKGLPDMMSGVNHLLFAIGALIVAIAAVVYFFVRHPRVQEEIHITK